MIARSSVSRLIALAVGAFVVLELGLWAALAATEEGGPGHLYNLPSPSEVRAMAESLDEASSARRIGLLRLFNGSLYSVRISASGIESEGQAADIAAFYEKALAGRSVLVTAERPALNRLVGSRSGPGRFFAPLTLAVGLRSGETLIIDGRPSDVLRLYIRQRAFAGALAGLALLIVLAVAVRQTSLPLRRLSNNIRDFAGDLSAPALPVTGGRELRDLAMSFNQMKARIAGLVQERTRILAAVAHDLRTYLTRLRLRVELLEDPEQRRRAIADLAEMGALLEDTLVFASPEAGAPALSVVDLGSELDALAERYREIGADVVFEALPTRTVILAAALPLRRMLANLIDNGIRHGDRVTVSVARRQDRVAIKVDDDGPGVAPCDLGKLGEPFTRLDPSRDRATGGAGLGLAIVRSLAERQNAEVSFDLGRDGGLSVTLLFLTIGGSPTSAPHTGPTLPNLC